MDADVTDMDGVTTWDARERAASMMKQDAALETLRREREPVMSPMGQDNELRDQALARARLELGAERMGQDRTAEAVVLPGGRLAAVQRGRDGLIARLGPGIMLEQTIRPGEWEQHEQAWQARRRRAENETLARFWGRDRCVKSGFFTEAEAREMDPERSRHVTLPPGLNGL